MGETAAVRHLLARERALRAELAEVQDENATLRALLAEPRPGDDPEHWHAVLAPGIAIAAQTAWADGRRFGWQEAGRREAEQTAITRRLLHNAMAPVLDPGGWAAQRATAADRAIRGAEAAEAREAADRERAFVARSYATVARDRNPVQAATVLLYPPPGTSS